MGEGQIADIVHFIIITLQGWISQFLVMVMPQPNTRTRLLWLVDLVNRITNVESTGKGKHTKKGNYKPEIHNFLEATRRRPMSGN